MGRGGGGSRGRGGGGGGGASSPSSGGGITPAAMDKAFDASPGAKDNFVTLADFRERLGGTRAEQDAAIRQGRLEGKFTLDTHEGLFNTARYEANRERYRAASVPQPGSSKPFIYISRR